MTIFFFEVMNIIIAGKSRECPKCKILVADDLYSFHVEWCQPLKSDEDFSDWAVELPEVSKSAIVCVHEKYFLFFLKFDQ